MDGQAQGQNHENHKGDEREFEVPFPEKIEDREKDPGIGGENEHGDAQGQSPDRSPLRTFPPEEIVQKIEEILFLEEHDSFFGEGHIPELEIEEKNSGSHENQTGHDSGGEQVTDGQLKIRFARIAGGRAQSEITPL
jgi:hypothetical protein